MHDFLITLALFKWVYIVGTLTGATCALLSVYVVLRRMAMLSEGVSHAGFGGIGVAMLTSYGVAWASSQLGIQIITGLFCLATALLIGYIAHAKKVTEDSAIGIFLVATVALGNLLYHLRVRLPGGEALRTTSVEQLLFGQISSVGPTDAILSITAAVIVFSLVGLFYSELLYVTLDEDMARVNGVSVRLINTLLLVLISLVIVVGVRMVGFLMITALTIIPGATATMLSRRFGIVLIISLLIGTLSALFAITVATNTPLAYYPSGPILVLTLFTVFLTTWIFRHVRKAKLQSAE